MLCPMRAFGFWETLAEVGSSGMDEAVVGCYAKIQTPGSGPNAASGIGADNAHAGLAAVFVKDARFEPHLQAAEVAIEGSD
jgi:hypothetical protein